MDRRQHLDGLVLGMALALTLACGCIVSPQPEPPTIDADRVWIELVSTNPDQPDAEPDTAIVHGDSGAVTPGGALLRVVNLDLTETVREVVVEGDGSFSVALGGEPGHVFRLRAFADELWSRPVDVVAPEETGPVEPAPHPLGDCFLVRSPSAVEFGSVPVGDIAVEVVTIENECGDPASIESIRLRIGDTQPPDCTDPTGQCFAEDGEVVPECAAIWEQCGADCDRQYQECIDSGEGSDQCDVLRTECADTQCQPELQACCEQVAQDCEETPYEEPQGFSALHGSVPMTVPSGSSRTIVITFAPLVAGQAEDALIIDIGSPESERRTITLLGRGVDD